MSVKIADLAAELAEAHDLEQPAALEAVEEVAGAVLAVEGAAGVEGGVLPSGPIDGELVLTDEAAQAVRDGLNAAQD